MSLFYSADKTDLICSNRLLTHVYLGASERTRQVSMRQVLLRINFDFQCRAIQSNEKKFRNVKKSDEDCGHKIKLDAKSKMLELLQESRAN